MRLRLFVTAGVVEDLRREDGGAGAFERVLAEVGEGAGVGDRGERAVAVALRPEQTSALPVDADLIGEPAEGLRLLRCRVEDRGGAIDGAERGEGFGEEASVADLQRPVSVVLVDGGDAPLEER